MKNILILIFCALLSGCGLFKKSKRIDRTLKSVEVSKEIEVKTETNQEQVDRSKTDVKSSIQTDEKTKVYPTLGTEVKINPNGSMVFQADSIIQDIKRNSYEAKNIVNDIISSLNHKKDSAKNEGRKEEQKNDQIEETKVPDKGAIFVNKIGWAVAFLVILIGVCWWFFGIGRRKKSNKK